VTRGGEPAHVQPDLADDDRRGDGADARDLIQPLRRPAERGDQLLDPGVEFGDVSADRVNAGEHLAQQEGVVIGEITTWRPDETPPVEQTWDAIEYGGAARKPGTA
jgi:hypothetical protein